MRKSAHPPLLLVAACFALGCGGTSAAQPASKAPKAEAGRANCVADEPCKQAPVPDCPAGLSPVPVFDTEANTPSGPGVFVGRLQQEPASFPMHLCEKKCCPRGMGEITLAGHLSVRDAKFEGIRQVSFEAPGNMAAVALSLGQGSQPYCRVDESGSCCTFADAAFEGLVLVRGNRTGEARIAAADVCRPRPEDYPDLTLGPPYESVLE